MNVVETLKARYLPLLDQAATRLREKHPTFTIKAGTGSVGSATTFQGHSFYLEALRLDSPDPEPNCVAIEVCVRDLPGTPTLCSLDVSWGGDGVAPSDGLYLLEGEIPFGPEALRLIDQALPRLERHFDRCLHDWEAAYPQSTSPAAGADRGGGIIHLRGGRRACAAAAAQRPHVSLPMDALSAIERMHGFKLPQPYRAFAERGYLTHPGDAYLWVNEAEWIPPADVPTYEWMGNPKPGLVPFAFTGGGDAWAWQTQRIMSNGEPAIAFCPHDSYEGYWHAPTFIGWLYRTGLEYATVIWEEEAETRKNLATWSQVVREFGDSAWAADLDEISRRPLLKYRVGRSRRDTEGLLHPDELWSRVAAAFGSDFVDAAYRWDKEGDAAAG